MKIYIWVFGLLVFSISAHCQGKFTKSFIINANVALFYPQTFDSISQLPSLAIENEPKIMGNLPSSWGIVPKFYSSYKTNIVTIPINKGTSLYGTGEVTGPLLRNGKRITLWNTDNYGYKLDQGKRLYQSHPWVLGVNADGSAFGIIADNSWKQELDLSDSIRFISEGKAFRVFVLKGSSPQEVIKLLAGLIGKMDLPPLWSLGYQQCRYSYIPDTRIKEIADTFRIKKIPCDVIWMDIDYMERYKVFTFDAKQMQNPRNVNDYLHSKGFKSIWMIDPGIKVEKDYSVFESGTKAMNWVLDKNGKTFNGTVWPGKCVFPDFTSPKTQIWWANLYNDYMKTGVDGVWNDMNEPSVFDGPGGTMPEDNLHSGGGNLPPGTHLRYHNVYGLLMIKSSREGILKSNPTLRPFILSRSGFLGSHRYGATWTGDNEATYACLKMSIPMSLNLGLSGQAFSGPDIGGFVGNTSSELYSQWIALGAFYPFSRGHSEKVANNKEPWAFGDKTEKVARLSLNRRYRLLPYLYTLFNESARSGMPVMRPVFFADPSDTTLRKEDQAFLLGNDLLVIPKWAVNPSLPKGKWTVVSLAGEQSEKDKYLPDVKIRDGAIIPLGKFIQSTTEYRTDSLTLLISFDKTGTAKGLLYEDAGNGFGYKKGDYLLSSIIATKHGKKVNVKFINIEGQRKAIKRKFKVIVVNDDAL